MPDEQPLDATALVEARARAGRAIRDIGHAFMGRNASLEQVERLAEALESTSAELWPGDPRARQAAPLASDEAIDYPQGMFTPTFDDRPISGRSSPWGLDLELHRHGDEIEARLMLRAAHEGAPGRSHGGIVAALFDDVFGYVLGMVGQPAFTGDLYVRYAAATPLHRELACRVRLDARTGRKLLMSGELTDVESGRLLATAKGTFIAVDVETFARLTAERPAPPDEDT
jgi:acyl-coenzyme A thioesterase PaaI-like protein